MLKNQLDDLNVHARHLDRNDHLVMMLSKDNFFSQQIMFSFFFKKKKKKTRLMKITDFVLSNTQQELFTGPPEVAGISGPPNPAAQSLPRRVSAKHALQQANMEPPRPCNNTGTSRTFASNPRRNDAVFSEKHPPTFPETTKRGALKGGMVLGEITDGFHRDRFRNARTSFSQVSESVLVGLARELDISVAREPPSCSLASPTDVQWSVKT